MEKSLRERASILKYTYIARPVNFITFTSLLPTAIRKSKNMQHRKVTAHKLE
jgi:hypothetical protein